MQITTRFYRAPEVIIQEQEYSSKVDMWALGCSFGEVLKVACAEEKIKNSNRYMFLGGSCYPLSPCEEYRKNPNKSGNLVSQDD